MAPRTGGHGYGSRRRPGRPCPHEDTRDSSREKEHHEDQGEAVERELPVAEAAKRLGQHGEEEGTDHRAPVQADASQRHHEHEDHREEEGEDLRADDRDVVRVETPRHGGVDRGEDEHAPLLRRGVDAHRLRRHLALAERAQDTAHPRVDEVARHPERGTGESPDEEVVMGGGGEVYRPDVPRQDTRQPRGATRDRIELDESQVEHHADPSVAMAR
jgi:hypothetical protein